jgi:hypothetical protein
MSGSSGIDFKIAGAGALYKIYDAARGLATSQAACMIFRHFSLGKLFVPARGAVSERKENHMRSDPSGTAVKPQARSRGALKNWPFALLCLFTLYMVGRTEIYEFSIARALVCLLLIFCLAIFLLPGRIERFAQRSFGRLEYIQITAPKLQLRIRQRYNSEIEQLTALGFNLLFFKGEAFSCFRLLLIYPLGVLLMMCAKREVLALHPGPKVMAASPVFADKERTTYGLLLGLGVLFHTLLQDGTLLRSANYGEDESGPHFIRRSKNGASIRETWEAHQQWIKQQQELGAHVAMEVSFPAYVEIARRTDPV